MPPLISAAPDAPEPRAALSRSFEAILTLVLAVGLAACDRGSEPSGEPLVCSQGDGLALYGRRIAPLLAADRPSSCNVCHLRGVDLRTYLVTGDDPADTPCLTMQNLLDRQLVSFTAPQSSRILEFIEKAEPATGLISEQVVAEEYEGFLEWIEWSASCWDYTCGVPGGGDGDADADVDGDADSDADADADADTDADADVDPGGDADADGDADVGGAPCGQYGACDPDALFDAFYGDGSTNYVYGQVSSRCAGCHEENGPSRGVDQNSDAITWLACAGWSCRGAGCAYLGCDGSRAAARETLEDMICLNDPEIGRIFDLADPDSSLLLQKPLNIAEVPHGGDTKMWEGCIPGSDPCEQDIGPGVVRGFISEYARCGR